jgi:peptide/nickel transport system permease protein
MDAPAGLLARLLGSRKGFGAGLVIALFVLIGLAAPVIAPYPYQEQHLPLANKPPSASHWLGTDEFGRDVASRIIWGARTSLSVAVTSITASVLIGIVLGAVAAYYGGWLDWLITAAADLTWSFPEILIALLLVAISGAGLGSVMFAISVAYLAQFVRLMRGQILSLKGETYVEATRSLGAGDRHILQRHLIPNALSPVIVAGMLAMGDAIVLEATLSFFGLGAQPPTPSWGSMMNAGTGLMFLAPWIFIFPGLAMAATVVGINLFGDAVIAALDIRRQDVAERLP